MKFLFGVLRYLVVIFAAAFLALVCLGGYLVVVGHVSTEKIELVHKALTGEMVPAESVGESRCIGIETRYDKKAVEEAQAALGELKKQEEETAVRLADRRSRLAQFDSEAGRIRREAAGALTALQKARKEFEDQKAAHEAQLKGDGFKKMKETFQLMQTENVAKILYDMDIDLAVELLKAFKKDERARFIDAIIEIDKTRAVREEKEIAPKLLNKIYEAEPRVVSVKTE